MFCWDQWKWIWGWVKPWAQSAPNSLLLQGYAAGRMIPCVPFLEENPCFYLSDFKIMKNVERVPKWKIWYLKLLYSKDFTRCESFQSINSMKQIIFRKFFKTGYSFGTSLHVLFCLTGCHSMIKCLAYCSDKKAMLIVSCYKIVKLVLLCIDHRGK